MPSVALLRVLRRKLRTFTSQVTSHGVGQVVPRAYARLNKLDLVQFGVRGAILPFRVQVIHQAKGPPPTRDEVVVLSVVRDGMAWLRTFFAHHRELGAGHFVMLDNGSTDGTREFLAQQPDVTLLTSEAPYRHYENTFKRYLCDKFARDRWCLFVDVDELFAYPGMTQRSLADLARFAGREGFTGVLCQMLDLFADGPMAAMPETAAADVREICTYYETDDIERLDYPAHPSTIAPPGARMHRGGVRHRLFAISPHLTKVSLFLNGGGLVPFHAWHQARNARLADFTAALLHYPFNRDYHAKVLEAASTGRYGWATTDEYRAYAAVVRENPDLSIRSAQSRRYRNPEQLVAEGFLDVSPAFAEWAEMDR